MEVAFVRVKFHQLQNFDFASSSAPPKIYHCSGRVQGSLDKGAMKPRQLNSLCGYTTWQYGTLKSWIGEATLGMTPPSIESGLKA